MRGLGVPDSLITNVKLGRGGLGEASEVDVEVVIDEEELDI